jgi:hypothetical protein
MYRRSTMNSHRLVPEREIYPFISTETIRPFVDNYKYRPRGDVIDVSKPTYKYITTSNSVTRVDIKKFHNHVNELVPAFNFRNWF